LPPPHFRPNFFPFPPRQPGLQSLVSNPFPHLSPPRGSAFPPLPVSPDSFYFWRTGAFPSPDISPLSQIFLSGLRAPGAPVLPPVRPPFHLIGVPSFPPSPNFGVPPSLRLPPEKQILVPAFFFRPHSRDVSSSYFFYPPGDSRKMPRFFRRSGELFSPPPFPFIFSLFFPVLLLRGDFLKL